MLPSRIRANLAYKLVVFILLFSGFLTLIVTTVQLFIEYRRDVRYLEVQFVQIEKSFLKPLSSALWRYSEDLIKAQLDGISQFRDIEYAEVRDDRKVVAAVGKHRDSDISATFPLTYAYKGEVRNLGRLSVSATYSGIYSRLYGRLLIVLASSAVKTFLTSFFMLALFQVLVMRHLKKIADYFQSYSLADGAAPLRLDIRKAETGRGDELHRIESEINGLIGRIRGSYDHAQELVKRRTFELEKTNEALKAEIRERKTAAERLRVSEEKFRNLIENSPDIVYRFSEEKGGVFVSRRVEDILGYSDLYVMENPFVWYDSIHPDDKTVVNGAIRNARKGERFDIEYRIRANSGGWRWFRDRSIGFVDAEDGFVIEGMATDITERKLADEALRQSEEKFRTVFDYSPIGISLVDAERRPVMSNRAITDMMGYTDRDLRGMTYRDFTHPEDIHKEGELYNELFGGSIDDFVLEKRNIRKDGAIIWVSLHAAAMQKDGGKPTMAVAMVQDITGLKMSQAELKRSNLELEQFAYAASHDLQEPLRAVLGFMQLFQSRCGDGIDEKGRHYIERAIKAGHRMQQLINDLLSLSRVNTRGNPFEWADFNHIVQNVLENLQNAIHEKNAEVVCAALPSLYVDATQIHMVFQNLIHNAVKYNTSPNPRVDIGVGEDRGAACCIFVKDNGIGIPPKFSDRIFQVFQRLHTDREYAGTGIGLSLCKRIVERHGGTIWVEPAPEGGSTFFFTLPKRMET